MTRTLARAAAIAGLTVLASWPASSQAATPGYQTVTIHDALRRDGSTGPATLRFDPCHRLRWAIDLADAPAGFVTEARGAVKELTAASGLPWSYAGLTKIRPDPREPAGVPARMHVAGLQLIISWSVADAANAAGTLRAQSATVTTIDGRASISPTQITAAAVVLAKAAQTRLVSHDDRGDGLHRLLLHQLGQAVGLAQVADANEIMSRTASPKGPTRYGPGDLAGLRAVGRRAGCL